MDSKNETSRWLGGIPYEVAFWKSYYGNRRRRADLFRWSGYGKQCTLDNFDIDSFISRQPTDSEPVIVDAGAALSYVLGTVIGGREMKIDYVDPLAPFYNDILDRYKIDRPRIRFGMIESLSASYRPDSVTFVHVRNALDHCRNPLEGIIQALVVLKPGGVLYLNHFRNEAERENYRGFHQFNISNRNGRLELWNRDTRIDVNSVVGSFARVEVSETGQGRVVAVITKNGPVPESLYRQEETTARMAEMVMTAVTYFSSPRRTLAYHWKQLYTTAGHRLMRLLPWSLLNRIKRMAGK